MHKCKPLLIPIILLLWATLLRFPFIGLTFLGADEGWYFYVGHQITQGYLPFVDLFDRKPIGLFLIYAFASLFGNYGIYAYQILALLCVWLTSFLIYKISCLSVNKKAAFYGALIYAPLLNCYNGHSGQSPVFYNSLTCLAFYLVLYRWPALKTSRLKLMQTGVIAMLLFGIALQIKYTVVFEGVFLGIFLLCLLFQATQKDLKKFLCQGSAIAVLWIGCAILPTFLVFVFYALQGHAHEWIFSNIQSGFLRSQHISHYNFVHALIVIAIGIFISASLLFSLKSYKENKTPHIFSVPIIIFILLWVMTSLLGAIALGEWHDHYFLPCFVPYAVAFGILCTYSWAKLIVIITTVILSFTDGKSNYHWCKENSISQKDIAVLAQKIELEGKGCMWNLSSRPFLSKLLPQKQCHLTPIAFGPHWSDEVELNALGVSLINEFDRIRRVRPRYIITSDLISNADIRTFSDMDVGSPSERLQQKILSFVKTEYHPFIIWETKDVQEVEVQWVLWETKHDLSYDNAL